MFGLPVVMSEKFKKYFDKIDEEVTQIYEFANKAKKSGVDITLDVECPPAKDMAGRVEKLVGPPGIGDILREWKEAGNDQDELCFRAMDLVLEKKIKPNPDEEFTNDQAIDLAIRVALAVKTEGVVSAPLEGIEKIILRDDPLGGGKFLSMYFAGPIRAAGGTVQAFAVLCAEYVREKMDIKKWVATDQEAGRYVEEVKLYDQIMNLQYPSTKEELEFTIRHLTVELNGQPTEKREVSAYRDLPRIDTNFVRGGPCLVLNDGLLLKSKKILKIIDKRKIAGWEWLTKLKKLGYAKKEEKPKEEPDNDRDKDQQYGGDTYIKGKGKGHSGSGGGATGVFFSQLPIIKKKTPVEKRQEELDKKNPPLNKYIADVIAGRPVFAGPSLPGGHRIRYGRSRNTGLAACGTHPSQMVVLDKFMAVGTQIRIERPGKSGSTMPVSSIEPPIVKLTNGNVEQLWDYRIVNDLLKDKLIDKILFVGDMLFGYGEFLENNHTILPSGYVEEWWAVELKEKLQQTNNTFPKEKDTKANPIKITIKVIQNYLENPLDVNNPPSGREALEIAWIFDIGIHPRYLDHWGNMNGSEFILVREAFEDGLRSKLKENNLTQEELSKTSWEEIEKIVQEGIRIVNTEEIKNALEKSFVLHKIQNNQIIIEKDRALIFIEIFGLNKVKKEIEKEKLEQIAQDVVALNVFPHITTIKIHDKSPHYMGSRMGRPEKAKHREMQGGSHTLFPIGKDSELGMKFDKANDKKHIEVNICKKICPECGLNSILNKCPKCGAHTDRVKMCSQCDYTETDAGKGSSEKCPKCQGWMVFAKRQKVNFAKYLTYALKNLPNMAIPAIKGVKNMQSDFKIPEPMEKGILRAKHDVYVYKDGTIRADATDIPLTHFTCEEIKTPIEKIIEMGYDVDIHGKPITSAAQVLEIKCQDVLLTEHLGDYFIRVADFVDDELEYLYKSPRFYNAKTRDDLIGHYMVGLAPHTSAGIIGRLIGFTKAESGYAHPFWHAAKRRNCDGDEDGIMLLMDCLMNFSMFNLPSKLGGKMDAPLVISVVLDPREVDGEAHNVDYMYEYPLQFFKDSQDYPKPSKLDYMEVYNNFLDTEKQFEGCGFTHPTDNINRGPKKSNYTILESMQDKLDSQMWLAKNIVSVDEKFVAMKVIGSHFTPDALGNLRSYSTQGVRCHKCGEKYRRVPLAGECLKCGNPKLLMTVNAGGIKKYIDKAIKMINDFELGEYMEERWDLIKKQVETMTNNPRVKQTTISSFFK